MIIYHNDFALTTNLKNSEDMRCKWSVSSKPCKGSICSVEEFSDFFIKSTRSVAFCELAGKTFGES